MNNYFITTYDKEWKAVREVLQERLSFKVVELHGKEYGNFPNKRELLGKEAKNAVNLLKARRQFKEANILICSNYCALFLLLMRKLRLIRFNKLFWYGVYIHQPKMMKIIRKVIHLIMPADTVFKIVVFSRPEIELYQSNFRLTADHFIYVPYGEWDKDKVLLEAGDEGYFFSGGYANRDFVALAKLFQNHPWKIKIAASRANEDFVKYCQNNELSENIEVLWDIPYEEFNRLLRHAHAVIMLMKYNTGASGQIVIMTALEYSKLVIASYTDVIDEYIKANETGIILTDKSQKAMEEVMTYINDPANAEAISRIREAGHKHFENTFSYKAISEYLVRAIQSEL